MSMNLCFDIKDSSVGMVEFPFQTPTNLTYKVLEEESTEERIKIINTWIDGHMCERQDQSDIDYINNLKKNISELMNCPTLKLSLI